MEALQFSFEDTGFNLDEPKVIKPRRSKKPVKAKTVIEGDKYSQSGFLFFDTRTAKAYLLDWVEDVGVDAVHQELLFTNLEQLRDCKKGGKTWNDISYWINKPFTLESPPFSFATCCRVVGLDDIGGMQEQIFELLK